MAPDHETDDRQASEVAPDSHSSTSDDRMMAMLCHLSNLLPIAFLIAPLVIWLIKKDQSRFVDDQGKEAVNFCLTVLLAHVVAGATVCFTMGILNLVIHIGAIVFYILAGVAANRGEKYRYLVCLRLIT